MRIQFTDLKVKISHVITYLDLAVVEYELEYDEHGCFWYIEMSDFDGDLMKIRHPEFFK